MQNKKWYNSRTIWFAVLTGVLGVVMAFQTQYPDIGIFSVLVGVINTILRMQTTTQIK